MPMITPEFREIAARHMPKGWRIAYWRTAPVTLGLKGYRGKAAEAGGLCDPFKKTVWINPDIFDSKLAPPEHTLFHEIGHVLWPCIGEAAYIGEYVAERYATKMCRAEGITVPHATLQCGKRYVMRTAFSEGYTMQTIRPDIRRWIGDLY